MPIPHGSVDKSNICYMELVDENLDSNDMRFVAELLLSTVSCENQAGYVILVGGGKTYQHLTEIKQTNEHPLKIYSSILGCGIY